MEAKSSLLRASKNYFDVHERAQTALELYALQYNVAPNECLIDVSQRMFGRSDPAYQMMTEKIVRKICRNHQLMADSKIIFYDVVLKEIDRYVAKTAVTGAETAQKTRSLKHKPPEAPSCWGYLLKRVAIVGGVVFAVGLLLHYLAVVQEMEEMQERIQALEERPVSGRAARPATARMMLQPHPSGGLMVQVLPDLPEPEPEEGALVPYRAPGLPAQRPSLALMDGVVQEPVPQPQQGATPLNARPVIVQVPAALADAVEAAAAAGNASDEESNDSGDDFDDTLKRARREAREARRCARVEQRIREEIKNARKELRRRENSMPLVHGYPQRATGGLAVWGKAALTSWSRWNNSDVDRGWLNFIKEKLRPYVYGPINKLEKEQRRRVGAYVEEMNHEELQRYSRGLGCALKPITPEMLEGTREVREREQKERAERYRVTKYLAGFIEQASPPIEVYEKYLKTRCDADGDSWQERCHRKHALSVVYFEEEIGATARMVIAMALGQTLPVE